MEDDVELAAAERSEVAHVATHVGERGPAAAREPPDRLELPRADVEERRVGAELGEEDRVPSAAAGERQHALSLERHAPQRVVRELVEEAALAQLVAWRRPLGARVRDAHLREALPHPFVVRGDVIDRDASGHDAIVASLTKSREAESPHAGRPRVRTYAHDRS